MTPRTPIRQGRNPPISTFLLFFCFSLFLLPRLANDSEEADRKLESEQACSVLPCLTCTSWTLCFSQCMFFIVKTGEFSSVDKRICHQWVTACHFLFYVRLIWDQYLCFFYSLIMSDFQTCWRKISSGPVLSITHYSLLFHHVCQKNNVYVLINSDKTHDKSDVVRCFPHLVWN